MYLYATKILNLFALILGAEYYYDLTEDFRYLELPMECFHLERDEKLKLLSEGKSLYLIDFFEDEFGKSFPFSKDDLVAGGNIIIFNKKFLLIPNFTPDSENYNRRSDCNWRILCQKNGAKITRVYLPARHVRENSFNLEKEVKKLEQDLIGNRFYRSFSKIVLEGYNYEKTKNESDKLYDELKRILYFNLKRIEALSMMIKNTAIEKIVSQYSESIKSFLLKDIPFTMDLYNGCDNCLQ